VAAIPGSDVTELLLAWQAGERGALDRLIPLVYPELRRLAHRHMRAERPGHHLQTTALVHEAFLRLVDAKHLHFEHRSQFYALAAQLMRRALVDAARSRAAGKRGGDAVHVSLPSDLPAPPADGTDLVALDNALTRLAAFDRRKEQVVELRYFGGLSVEETAEVLEISPDTVKRDWKMARWWLLRELEGRSPSD